MKELPFCKCGCGKRVSKPGNKYIYNHHLNDQWKNEEYKKKMQGVLKNGREKIWQDPKYREKQSAKMKKQWKDEKYRKVQSERLKKQSKKNWQNPKHKKEQSKIMRKLWQDSNFKKKHSRICKKTIKKTRKKLVQPGINKSEQKLLDLMKNLGINNFPYTGDKTCNDKIGKYYPDFTCKKQKKIIEFFGDYWHSNRHDAPNRVKYYKKLGWNCIVIWGSEFKNMEKLKKKLLNFCKKN